MMGDDGFCCEPDSGDCCGPGSWCCKRAGKHDHEEDKVNDGSAQKEPIKVHELGEDGGLWMVSGTTADVHPETINSEVAKWVIETCGVKDGMAIDVIERLAEAPKHTFADDWCWVPMSYRPADDDPSDEAYLRRGKDVPDGLPRFAGTLVQA